MDEQVVTIILAIIGALGSTQAWAYWQRRQELKRQDLLEKKKDDREYQDDLRERVAVLEGKLQESHDERDELLQELRKLSEICSALKVEVEFLRKENTALRESMNASAL